MASASTVTATSASPLAWQDELASIKASISRIYGTDFKTWIDEWTKPSPSGRTRANPYPWTFYLEVDLNLKHLYARAVELACANGNYNDLVDVLAFLRTVSPEQGRDLYASCTVLGNSLISPENKTKCAYGYMAGMLQGKFSHDIIADHDAGDVGVVLGNLTARVPELNCPALPVVAAVRVVIYPTKYKREAKNASALDESKWLPVAHTLVQAAPTSTADALVAMMKAAE